MPAPAKVLAVANQKGGVGKTTTTVNVGAVAAVENQRRVLIIDCDPQCNATRHLDKDPESLAGLSEAFATGDGPARSLGELVEKTSTPGLDLIPGPTEGLESKLIQSSASAGINPHLFVLADGIKKLRDNYDTIIIDAPPGLGIILQNILIATDTYLVPIHAEGMSIQGLSSLLDTADRVSKPVHERMPALNPNLRMAAILFTRYDPRPMLSQNIVSKVKEQFADAVIATPIRRNTDLAAAASMGQTILEYNAESNGAADYRAVTSDLIARGVI